MSKLIQFSSPQVVEYSSVTMSKMKHIIDVSFSEQGTFKKMVNSSLRIKMFLSNMFNIISAENYKYIAAC